MALVVQRLQAAAPKGLRIALAVVAVSVSIVTVVRAEPASADVLWSTGDQTADAFGFVPTADGCWSKSYGDEFNDPTWYLQTSGTFMDTQADCSSFEWESNGWAGARFNGPGAPPTTTTTTTAPPTTTTTTAPNTAPFGSDHLPEGDAEHLGSCATVASGQLCGGTWRRYDSQPGDAGRGLWRWMAVDVPCGDGCVSRQLQAVGIAAEDAMTAKGEGTGPMCINRRGYLGGPNTVPFMGHVAQQPSWYAKAGVAVVDVPNKGDYSYGSMGQIDGSMYIWRPTEYASGHPGVGAPGVALSTEACEATDPGPPTGTPDPPEEPPPTTTTTAPGATTTTTTPGATTTTTTPPDPEEEAHCESENGDPIVGYDNQQDCEGQGGVWVDPDEEEASSCWSWNPLRWFKGLACFAKWLLDPEDALTEMSGWWDEATVKFPFEMIDLLEIPGQFATTALNAMTAAAGYDDGNAGNGGEAPSSDCWAWQLDTLTEVPVLCPGSPDNVGELGIGYSTGNMMVKYLDYVRPVLVVMLWLGFYMGLLQWSMAIFGAK